MIKHNLNGEITIENLYNQMKEMMKTINIHTSILNHYIKYTLHLNSLPQSISYLRNHEDEELMKYMQTVYNFTQEEYETFGSDAEQVASQDESTKEQLDRKSVV